MAGNFFDQFDGQRGGVFTLPPSPQQVRDNNRQDRNDARTAENEARRIALEEARLRMAQEEAAQRAAAAQAAAMEAQQKSERFNLARTKAIDDINRGLGAIDATDNRLAESGGWWELGKTGGMSRAFGTEPGDLLYSGSDAADFDAMIKPAIAGGTINSLTEMRNASPTGAAVGNPTDRDMDLLKAAIGDLSPTQTTDGYRRSLRTARDAFVQNLTRIDPAQGANARVAAPLVQQNLSPSDAMRAVQASFVSLRQQMQGKTPAERQAMLRAHNESEAVRFLKERAGFRDPGGRGATAGAPRKAGGDIPVLTPEQARALPRGASFRTTDGRVLVRQ